MTIDTQLTHEIIEANAEARRLDHQRAVRIERAIALDTFLLLAVSALLVFLAWTVTT